MEYPTVFVYISSLSFFQMAVTLHYYLAIRKLHMMIIIIVISTFVSFYMCIYISIFIYGQMCNIQFFCYTSISFSSCLGRQMGILIFGSSMISVGEILVTATLSYSHPQCIPISGTQPEGN